MKNSRDEIASLQANLCGAVSEASRISIIYELANGPRNVTSLADEIGISYSSTSHHLKILKEKEFVYSERNGSQVIYSLATPKLIQALDIFLEILDAQLSHRANLVKMEREE